jgi:GT2 family glycosyltransferase
MDVSIIIVNYNVKDLLFKCLSSVKKYFPSNYSYEIIIVDNNSNDGSVDGLKKMFPEVTMIENKLNIGFSAANNQGIGVAKGNLIFLLNPDTELIDSSLIHLLQFISENTTGIIAGPKLINSDSTFQNSCYKFPQVSQIILEAFYLHLIFNNRTYPQNDLKQKRQVDALSGAVLIFKKELIAKTGMLDENLFWMEDIDLCFRNVKNGGINMYFPQTVIGHYGGGSSRKNYIISISNQVISKVKYFKKNSGRPELFIAVAFSYMHVFTRITMFGFFSVFSKKCFRKFNAYTFTMKKLTGYLMKRQETII